MTGLPLWSVAFLALVTAVLVILLYRLKDHRSRLVVAFVGLWEIAQQLGPSVNRRERRRHYGSVVLQIGIAMLICAALVTLEPSTSDPATQHLVVLLDVSASMAADEHGESRFENAQRELIRQLALLDETVVVLLATTDSRTTPTLSWTRDHRLLRDAILRQGVHDRTSNWSEGLARAASYLRGRTQPRLWLVTDGTTSDWSALQAEPELTSIPVEAILVGSRRKNVGIVTFSARAHRDADRGLELLLGLVNDDDRSHDVDVELTSHGRRIGTEQLNLPAGARKTATIRGLDGFKHVIRARLVAQDGAQDALPLDDSAYAVLPEVPQTRVAIISAGDLYLEAAVLSDPSLEATLVAPGVNVDSKRFDAAIYDGVEPAVPLTMPSFLLNPPRDGRLIQVSTPLRGVGFDSWAQKDVILRDLDLYDVQIDRANALIASEKDVPLAFAGHHTILLRGEREGQPIVAMGFAPHESDFVMRSIWPLFVHQVLTRLLGRDLAEVRSTRPGEVVTLPVDSVGSPIRLTGPGGLDEMVSSAGTNWQFVPERLGLYRVELPQRQAFVAANLGSANESRIAPMRPLKYAGRTLPAPKAKPKSSSNPSHIALAAMAMALLLVEWIAFHRRWTL